MISDAPRYDPNRHDRQSTRLRGWDYAHPAAYFITICTHGRECLFGDVENRRMRLTTCGRIVVERWRALPRHFRHVTLDAFAVMPNHVHGIVVIKPSRQTCTNDSDCRGEASEPTGTMQPFDGTDATDTNVSPISDASPLREIAQTDPPPQNGVKQPTGTTPGSLGAVVQNFKSTATRKINRYRSAPGLRVWQRGYYDRIIRDERELNAVRNYIRQNPKRWEEDRNNPAGDE